jgi:hypothetical protein
MVKHFYKNEEKQHLLLSSVVIHTTYSIFNSGGACSGHVSAIVLLSCVLQSLFSPFSPLPVTLRKLPDGRIASMLPIGVRCS